MHKQVSLSELLPVIQEALKNQNEVVLTVNGDSMAPLLRHGRDKVCLVCSGGRSLNKYDLPLYIRSDGKYILHRILAVKKDAYVTVGDNQKDEEYPVYPSQVVGVVKGIWREGKYISCDSFKYRMYCWFWTATFPVRRCYFKWKRLWAKRKKG